MLAENAHNVAVTGRGTINGRGGSFTVKDGAPGRPFGIKFIDCKDALIADVRVEDAAAWVIHLLRCERAIVRGVRVWSHANYNNDGLDIDACSDVTVTNCTLVAPRYSRKLNGTDRGIGGINLELVDGGVMDRITISNITMDGITLPLFIRLGDRGRRNKRPTGSLRNVVISNINFSYEGGGTAEDVARAVRERPDAYPEGTMYGTLPAWGLYCRHVKGLKLHNITLQLAAPDARHAVVFDDVTDLDIDHLNCAFSPGAAPMLKMVGVRDATIRGCRPTAPDGVFLQLQGLATARIALLANDLRRAGKWLETATDVEASAVAQSGNLLP